MKRDILSRIAMVGALGFGLAVASVSVGAALAFDGAGGSRPITYVAPSDLALNTRVVGQSRGVAGGPSITVLAPDSTGTTTLAQPTLYWHTDRPISGKVEFTLVDEASDHTVFETVLDQNVPEGVSALPLGRYRVSLRTDRDYRWSISVIRDPNQRSLDVFTSGTIRRTDMPKPLAMRLNKTSSVDMPYFLAENGLWYDAMAVLSVQIMRNPEDQGLLAARASLLNQVGLADVSR